MRGASWGKKIDCSMTTAGARVEDESAFKKGCLPSFFHVSVGSV